MNNFISKFQKNIGVKELFKKLVQLIRQPILTSIILVSSITLLVKVLGFFKESVVAGEFGLSQQLDTFYIAMLIPGFITTVFLGSFNNVFIPNYISELRTGNDIRSFQSMGFLVVTGISIIFLSFSILVTDIYLKNFFAGHTEEYYHSIKVQFYFLAPCIIIWGLSTFIGGLLNINNHFKYSSWDSIFISLVILICVFFFKEDMGKVVLAAGTLIGSVVNFTFLLIVAYQKKVISLGKPDFKNSNAILMLKQVPAKASSAFFTGLISVTDQYFCAQLAIGSIAAINYGLKIPAFITGLLIISINNVLLPYFSEKVIQDKSKAFKDLFKTIKWLFIASCAIVFISILLSDALVQLFYERNEFTSEDSRVVSIIQKIALLHAPFTICGMVLVNFLTSINKNSVMAWVSLGSLLCSIVLDYILMKFYGVYGITIATTLVYSVRSIILFMVTLNHKKEISTEQL